MRLMFPVSVFVFSSQVTSFTSPFLWNPCLYRFPYEPCGPQHSKLSEILKNKCSNSRKYPSSQRTQRPTFGLGLMLFNIFLGFTLWQGFQIYKQVRNRIRNLGVVGARQPREEGNRSLHLNLFVISAQYLSTELQPIRGRTVSSEGSVVAALIISQWVRIAKN